MTQNVPNQTNDAHTTVGDAPRHPISVTHHREFVRTRAAFALAEDGKVVISFDERMEQDEMNAAFLKMMEAARTLL